MGAHWLGGEWIDALRDYGATLEFWDGYETRSRSSGGFDEVLAVGLHHDAVPVGVSTYRRGMYAWHNAPFEPVGNLITRRNGNLVIGALGATNTQGRSEQPHPVSKGVISTSKGNLYMPANEIECDGVGQPYTPEQIVGVEAFCAATCDVYGLNPLTDIISHHRYTSRKVDPRGFTPDRAWGPGVMSEWDDHQVGLSVLNKINSHKGSNMGIRALDKSFRWLDTRQPENQWHSGKIKAGETIKIPSPFGFRELALSLNTINSEGEGYLKVYGGEEPNTSAVNYKGGRDITNMLVLVKPGSDGHIRISAHNHATDLFIDVWGRDLQ